MPFNPKGPSKLPGKAKPFVKAPAKPLPSTKTTKFPATKAKKPSK